MGLPIDGGDAAADKSSIRLRHGVPGGERPIMYAI
jgi:hypothetical protein